MAKVHHDLYKLCNDAQAALVAEDLGLLADICRQACERIDEAIGPVKSGRAAPAPVRLSDLQGTFACAVTAVSNDELAGARDLLSCCWCTAESPVAEPPKPEETATIEEIEDAGEDEEGGGTGTGRRRRR
jgi:hypothetical protein